MWGDLGGGFREYKDSIKASLTPEQAAAVRVWRVDEHQSWRGVASAFCERYPDVEFAEDMGGNQILGAYLCEAAAEFLGEDPHTVPWN